MSFSRTIIIGCAGMGSRLGMETTKALLEIDGKPIIIRHLENLENEEDVRIVVGYQAKKLIDVVRSYRNDIIFVFNHDYRTTSTGTSVSLAAYHGNEYVMNLDGDLLVHPDDMKRALNCKHEFISGGNIETDDPWMLQTEVKNGEECVVGFSKTQGSYEWNGITQVKREKFTVKNNGHVFRLLEPHLPLPFMPLRTKEVDTINDYERAANWVKNGFVP